MAWGGPGMRHGVGAGCIALGQGGKWGDWGGREGGNLGISDLPKRGVNGFHVKAMGPNGEDCLEGNFIPTNDYLNMNVFL